MKPGYLSLLLILLLIHTTPTINAQGIFQLWGMTNQGGDDNKGLIFNIDARGDNLQPRHHFTIGNPGIRPQLTHMVEYNGKFYGMAQGGGNTGSGLIFEWDPATNTYTKRFSFNNYNGANPLGSLYMVDGKFYGMTEFGGDQGQGVIFEWNPNTNVYNIKIHFRDNFMDGFNGSRPAGNLMLCDGKFYGMTAYGGNNDKGVIFEWDHSTNQYTKKIDLSSTTGYRPFADLVSKSGKLYGMTSEGGNNDKGVIFEWDPVSNVYTKKINFDGNIGSSPYGNLVERGAVFIGLASHGGNSDNGVLFEWNPSTNHFSKKYDFDAASGYWPGADLVLKDGKYYSTAFRGGANDGGVLFEWDPALDLFTKKIDLGTSDGKFPQSNPVLHNGRFYGITTQGGNFNKGVLYEWNPSSNTYAKKIDLHDESKGLNPVGSLAAGAGKRYGMTNTGGANGKGVIFEYDPSANSNAYTKKIDLSTAIGSVPYGNLTWYAGKFYGMTSKGGDNDLGTIFEYDPASNTYTKKIDFDFTNGSTPLGSLTLSGTKFYGMTSSGGSTGNGVIFEWEPATNSFTRKIDMTTVNGSKPAGNLVEYNGKFYGLTKSGGVSNRGVIFEWDPTSNVYTRKIVLTVADGSNPPGSLSLLDGMFFGVTEGGGSGSAGVIFEWDPINNVYTKRHEFSFPDAAKPLGGLTYSNGMFYGMTEQGGNNDLGVIFEWDPATDTYTKKRDFTAAEGSNGLRNNNFSLLPAPVAKGIPGSCVSFPAITIDNTNNNVWVPITDHMGDAVAEIRANGNNLGIVSTSAYINNATVREDGNKKLYMDRNLTITPQFPISPGSSVEIRLYIRNAEYMDLKNATNSDGQPSGISGISDIGIYKNDDACSASIGFTTHPVLTTAVSWEGDHVLTATINSFSSFYFANIAQGGPLPIANLEFNGRLDNTDANIKWKTTNEFNLQSFDLERSTDGSMYKTINKVDAHNQAGIHQYNYIDKNIISLGVPVVYYRLKQTDRDGRFNYSGIVALEIKSSNLVILYPNPVVDKANLSISNPGVEAVQLRIIDNTGRIVKQQSLNVAAGNSAFSIDMSNLARGVYYLELKGETVNEHKQFIKQ